MPRRQAGQSTVEFSIVVLAFLLIFFAAMAAAFHSIQRAMAETAAGTGVELAASASPGQLNTPAMSAAAFGPTRQLLSTVMFATTIQQGCGGPLQDGVLQVCVFPDGQLVGETVRGRPAFLFPIVSQWLQWNIDVTVEMHQVSYQP